VRALHRLRVLARPALATLILLLLAACASAVAQAAP
jgi:hypothetical protein